MGSVCGGLASPSACWPLSPPGLSCLLALVDAVREHPGQEHPGQEHPCQLALLLLNVLLANRG